MKIQKIISGGQTGADRAALDFALEKGIETGGFVPKERRAEDGPIPENYPNLVETGTRNYAERTQLNILNSDATIILSHGKLTGGSLLTKRFAKRHEKPFLHIDFLETDLRSAFGKVSDFINLTKCKTLNVAGPRASGDSAIYSKTINLLKLLFD